MIPLLFVIFCTAFHTTAESSASFEAAGHVSRAACIQNQQQAFTTLQPHLQSLQYVPGLPLIGKDGHMISTWKVESLWPGSSKANIRTIPHAT